MSYFSERLSHFLKSLTLPVSAPHPLIVLVNESELILRIPTCRVKKFSFQEQISPRLAFSNDKRCWGRRTIKYIFLSFSYLNQIKWRNGRTGQNCLRDFFKKELPVLGILDLYGRGEEPYTERDNDFVANLLKDIVKSMYWGKGRVKKIIMITL